MYIFLSIILVVLAVLIHELSHALAMKKRGVTIKEIAIGIKIPRVPSIATFRIEKIFPGTDLKINHLPILAYVRPVDEDYEKNLTIKDKIAIFGARPLANILFSCLLSFIAVSLIAISAGIESLYWKRFIMIAVASVILGAVLRYGRNFFYRIAPIASFILMAYLMIPGIAVKNAPEKQDQEIHQQLTKAGDNQNTETSNASAKSPQNKPEESILDKVGGPVAIGEYAVKK